MSDKQIRIVNPDDTHSISACIKHYSTFISSDNQITWKKQVIDDDEKKTRDFSRFLFQVKDMGSLIECSKRMTIIHTFKKSEVGKYIKFYSFVENFLATQQYTIFYVEDKCKTNIRVRNLKRVDSKSTEATVGQEIKLKITEYNVAEAKVSDDVKKDIKWMVRVGNATDERLIINGLVITGHEIEFEVPREWGDKEILFMPYFSKHDEGISTPINVTAQIFTFPIVIDRYKMPGLNPEGTDIAKDMTYGFGTKYFNPIYEKTVVDNYIASYRKRGFVKNLHNVFSNAKELELPATNILAQQSNNTIYGNIEKINKAKNRKAIYSESDFPGLASFLNNLTSLGGGISGHSDQVLFATFKDMAKVFFSPFSSDMRKNIDNMIEKFRRNEGGVYENPLLEKHIIDHESTNRYCNQLENYIKKKLNKHKGDINNLKDEKVYFNTDSDIKERVEQKEKTYSRTPQYDGNFSWKGLKNATRGRAIALGDIWATEVSILNFERTGNNYTLEYEVTLYDHFGLNMEDIKIDKFGKLPAGLGAGFRAWFILQHFRGYKPFVTKITFSRKFEGKIQ